MAGMYALAPLHQPLLKGFHNLEHSILNTNGNHSHDIAHDSDLAHEHEHQLLSFFNNLFDDANDAEEQFTKEFKLDKHIVQLRLNFKVRGPNAYQHTFIYLKTTYHTILSTALPPPENCFS